jgi:two-component system chemotaxis response regulator CheY
VLTPATTKVLLIDDHAVTRSLLRAMLRDVGYVQIREAADGEIGLKLAAHLNPDLICLDVEMPGRRGVDLLADLRMAAPSCKIVMVTANGDRDTVLASANSGAAGYIVKPFNAASIQSVVRRALGGAGDA